MEHFSWNKLNKSDSIFNKLELFQKKFTLENKDFKQLTENFQNELIPVVDLQKINIFDKKHLEIILNKYIF